MEKMGVQTIICTDISKDGAMQGTNRKLYKELSEKFDIQIESEHNTVNGWCCEMLNGIPNENDEFIYNNYKFIIEKVNDKCVEEVIVSNISEK